MGRGEREPSEIMLTGVVENFVRVPVLVRAIMRMGMSLVRVGVREARLARAREVVDELDSIRRH